VSGATVCVSLVILAGCGGNLGAPESASDQGDTFIELWRIFFIGAVLVSVLIWALVIIAVVRFRRRRGSEEGTYPSQRQYNIPWEIGYTVVPLVIVAVLFGLTLVGQERFTELTDDPAVEVEVVGFQWQWQFRYVDDGITVNGTDDTDPVLVVPAGETVRFQLVAEDVNHSFWVPAFLEKRDLIPQVDNTIDVTMKEPGEWKGRCAEYCGLDHWKMVFTLRAVPRADYDAWVAAMQDLPQPVLAPDAPEAGS
jgi:cytochrome c oxidase subunit II